jgi:hypothetical protein
VLSVLQTEWERKEDEDTVDDAGQPQAPVDTVRNTLEISVYNVTKEFGFAPSDVYNGVLELPRTMEQHAAAVKGLNHTELRILVRTFSVNCQLVCGFSCDAAVRYPCSSTPLDRFDN